MITYERIAEVNKDIKYKPIHGKNYAEVAQRVQGFRKLYPEGFIETNIISLDNGVVYMKAEAGYHGNDGHRFVLATGYAFERQDASMLNKTSFIENCETSAIGRALGFIGIGTEDTIASREELEHAIETQEAIKNGQIPDPAKPAPKAQTPPQTPPKAPAKPQSVQVTTTATVPAVTPQKPAQAPKITQPPQPAMSPVMEYLAKEREELRQAREMDKAENTELWNKQLAILKANKIVPDKPLSQYTQKEATLLVNMMYARFDPHGTELKPYDGDVA